MVTSDLQLSLTAAGGAAHGEHPVEMTRMAVGLIAYWGMGGRPHMAGS